MGSEMCIRDRIRVLGDMYIHVHDDKCVHRSVNSSSSSVTIVNLPLISHFISNMQTMLGSFDH